MECLHFVEDDDPADLNKCKMIIDNFNNTINRIVLSWKKFKINESMILFRGRLIFRQYEKGKRHKYEIKMMYWQNQMELL